MNVRLVAYRIPTSSDTVEDAYNLDLEKAPNVSLNFRFSDVKKPETRKASYSQTFKLPFTDKNNDFFQNWFNVNLDTLVFNTKTKFNATLYVGTVPQFEGYIQLKAVYQKAKRYEVVLMSNTSDLFTAIGEKKLRDVYLEDNGSYSDELNHLYTEANIKASWDGSSSSFQNTSGVSLRDSSAGVQKIVYPLTATKPNFYFSDGSNRFLDMSQTDIDNINASFDFGQGIYEIWNLTVNIDQLRPAIQLKELINKIMARAGFSYTSNFIDGSYFGKLYMTLGNKLGTSVLPVPSPTLPAEGGYLIARTENSPTPGFTTGWSSNPLGDEMQYPFSSNNSYNCTNAANAIQPDPIDFQAEDDVDDANDVWNGFGILRESYSMDSVLLRGEADRTNVMPVCGSSVINIDITRYNVDTGEDLGSGGSFEVTPGAGQWNTTVSLEGIPLGVRVGFKLQPPAMKQQSFFGTSSLNLFDGQFIQTYNNGNILGYSFITCNWVPYNPSQYNQEVLIPSCIDDEITQKAFLKDIIQRFNLVIVQDPNDPSNIIIEPYNDYFDLGTIKDWTEKIDLSKEVIVKDTTSLQKRIINLTDLEDVDLLNKTIKDYSPKDNVYGKYYSENEGGGNDFATGELKNESIFSPYINQKIFTSGANQESTHLGNVAIQYELTYKQSDTGYDNSLEETNPKLFYYCGTPTDIRGFDGSAKTIHLHRIVPTTGVTTAHSFTTYPVCTAYDITPDASTDTYTLSTSNKSLFWGNSVPMCGEVEIFNYQPSLGFDLEKNSLFFLYWKNYLDSIYSTEARIMEAHLNLDAADILDFKFNDEVFIKDTWWRIQTIENYQVGAKASTKVTFLKKTDDAVALPQNCDYVNSGNYFFFLTWCPSSDVGCTPQLTAPYAGLYAPTACCEAAGGFSWTAASLYADQGLYPCIANASSLPMQMRSLESPLALFNKGNLKTMLTGKLGGLNIPLTAGGDRGKSSKPLLPQFGDDIVIKYKNKYASTPSVVGENHRMILIGNTTGTTRGYAYPENDKYADTIFLPNDSNVMISVKGVTTIVGGTNATYVVGTTESFSYNTVFIVSGGLTTQVGNAGGVLEWSIKDTSLSTTSTMYIDTNSTNGGLRFGLDDSQADTEKAWTLTVDITVQRLNNLSSPFNTNWAIWQKGGNIRLMNFSDLIWN